MSTSNTPEGSPSPKKPKFAHVKTVTLYVGKDKVDFQVHEDTLFDASPLFRKAFTSEPEEDSEQVLDFSDDDPGLFGHLITCIYSKSFSMDIFEDAKSAGEKEVEAAQLFVLAEKYGVEIVLLNICIKLRAHGKEQVRKNGPRYCDPDEQLPPERRAVEIAYKYTYRASSLRKVFVDWYVMCSVDKDTGVREWLATVPEFAADLIVTPSRTQEYFRRRDEDYLLRLTGKAYKAV